MRGHTQGIYTQSKNNFSVKLCFVRKLGNKFYQQSLIQMSGAEQGFSEIDVVDAFCLKLRTVSDLSDGNCIFKLFKALKQVFGLNSFPGRTGKEPAFKN